MEFNSSNVNQNNISSELGIVDSNYEIVRVDVTGNLITLTVVGKGKWEGLTGTVTDNELIVEDTQGDIFTPSDCFAFDYEVNIITSNDVTYGGEIHLAPTFIITDDNIIYINNGKLYVKDDLDKYSISKDKLKYTDPSVYLNGLDDIKKIKDIKEEKIDFFLVNEISSSYFKLCNTFYEYICKTKLVYNLPICYNIIDECR